MPRAPNKAANAGLSIVTISTPRNTKAVPSAIWLICSFIRGQGIAKSLDDAERLRLQIDDHEL